MIKDLKEETLKFIEINGFDELTNVQKETLKVTKKNLDVFVRAKTGTGKTHAYLIPIMEMINPKSNKTQVLISLPTRELAYQVYENTKLMKEVYPDLRISFLSGGTDRNKTNLKPHIIVGTPGRIKDIFTTTALAVNEVKMFIIDEADMTLEYGFIDDIDVVFSNMKKNPEVMCLSATCPKQLELFIKRYLNNPKVIQIEDKKRNPNINHILVNAKHREYKEELLRILPGINPYVCMIFANSKKEVEEVYNYLQKNNIACEMLHGDMEARKRKQAMKLLASEKCKYIVCSDVASRGIDVDGVSHVISLGIPKEKEFYLHRAGRTGRNSRNGTCFVIYKEQDIEALKAICKLGVTFKAQDFKNGVWKNANNPTVVKERKFKDDKEIVKLVTKKKEKVKPNYKKKKNEAIEKIKRKKRREFIQGKIKEERVERYKQKTREKKGY